MGIEVPNSETSLVALRGVMEAETFQGLEKDLSCQVFGYCHIFHTGIGITIDHVHMAAIELTNGPLVSLLGQIDQTDFAMP